MAKPKIKKEAIAISAIFIILCLTGLASAASLSLSLGSYDSEIYTQDTINIPVTITASNITGSTDVTLTPKTGLSCSTCTLSYTFTGASSEQGTVTFTLTGTQTGTYNPPFLSVSAASGSTSATPLSSGNQITVVEKPTWVKSFTASDSSPDSGDEITLTLTLTPSGTFEGVSADLALTSGLTRVSGSDPRTIGTISGESSYQWIVRATSSGTASVAITSTSPSESASDNTETLTITVAGTAGTPASSTSGGGGGGGSLSGGTTYTLTDQEFLTGYNKEITKNDQMRVNIDGDSHSVKLVGLTNTSATINVSSITQQATLSIGEEKKFEVTGDTYYDILVKLNSINFTANKASFTIKKLNEAGATPTLTETTPTTTNPTTPESTPSTPTTTQKHKNLLWLWILIAVVIVIAIIIFIVYMTTKKADNKNRKVRFIKA
jgi:hypothetical protein